MKVQRYLSAFSFYGVFAMAAVTAKKTPVPSTPTAVPLSQIKVSFVTPYNETKDVSLAELKKDIKEKGIAVYEPHIPDGVSDLVGFPLIEVLDKYIGEKWRKADGVLFHALDGYKYDVSVPKILKYKPYLVYQFKDPQKEFKVDIPAVNQKDVPLGPFYLVWDNINNVNLRRYGYYDWPYEIAKIETIQYPIYYAKAFPIKDPSQNQVRGFEFYKAYCISCHSISGDEGGKKANVITPLPLFAKKDLKKFKEWVLEPLKAKSDTQMPALNKQLTEKERNEVSDLIFDYLVALDKSVKK